MTSRITNGFYPSPAGRIRGKQSRLLVKLARAGETDRTNEIVAPISFQAHSRFRDSVINARRAAVEGAEGAAHQSIDHREQHAEFLENDHGHGIVRLGY